MLFNSNAFIFVFFPLVLAGFFLLGARRAAAAAGFLALASLVFYADSGWKVLPLLLGSICVNYGLALHLAPAPGRSDAFRKRLLVAALAANLSLLGVFKYANFFVSNLNGGLSALGMAPFALSHIALPVGISFYTFTQIAFLVDSWQGKVRETRFLHYLLFVTYFPHLIAGPVLHHAQMMPQFADPATYRPDPSRIALGLATFTFGLAKKLLLANPLGQCADLVFNGVQHGTLPTLATSWLGALAYTLQIYFDFSGYSDMAVGLSLCFGVVLPLNFMSPYKSTSIIEFWRRWHISLSTFLRDYLYVPLGGNRHGEPRRYLNLFITMLLGGLWHGAAWTFVAWGALHGLLLAANHLWNALRPGRPAPGLAGRAAGWLVTFACVVLAWVVFRADSLSTATALYKGMLGLNGAAGPALHEFGALPFRKSMVFQTLLVGLVICLALPPTQALARWVPQPLALAARPGLSKAGTALMAAATVALFAWCASKLGHYSPFLYFQF